MNTHARTHAHTHTHTHTHTQETLMDLIFEMGADCNPPTRANTQETMRFSKS